MDSQIKPQVPLSIEDVNSLYTVTLTLSKEGQDILSTLEQFICREFNITKNELRSELRYLPLPRARGAFTSILRTRFDFPLKLVGLYLGGRDHSTILMAEQRAKQHYKKDMEYRRHYDNVEANFVAFLEKNGLISKAS